MWHTGPLKHCGSGAPEGRAYWPHLVVKGGTMWSEVEPPDFALKSCSVFFCVKLGSSSGRRGSLPQWHLSGALTTKFTSLFEKMKARLASEGNQECCRNRGLEKEEGRRGVGSLLFFWNRDPESPHLFLEVFQRYTFPTISFLLRGTYRWHLNKTLWLPSRSGTKISSHDIWKDDY